MFILGIINKIPVEKLEDKRYSFKSFIYVLAICTFEMFLLYTLLPILFEENDDVGMMNIVSGAYNNRPSEYMLFSNILIGKLLKYLFTIIPTINWYTWYLIVSILISYTGIQYSFNKIKAKPIIKIIRHFLILSILLFSLIALQFTRVAAIALTAGMLLLFTSNKKEYIQIGFGILLIILGTMIRKEVLYMYILLSLPFIIYFAINNKTFKIINIIIAILLSFTVIWHDNLSYEQNTELNEYREFNKLRAKITTIDHHSFNYINKKQITESIGWTKNDFYLATIFNLDIGHPKFTKKNLKIITANNETFFDKTLSINIIKQLKPTLSRFFEFLNKKYIYIYYCFIFLLFFSKKIKELVILFIYLLYVFLISFILFYYLDGSLHYRVLFGLTFPVFLLSIYYFNFISLGFFKIKIPNFITVNIIKPLLLIIAILSVILPTIACYNGSSLHVYSQREKLKQRAEWLNRQNNEFYVSWLDFGNYNLFSPPTKMKNLYSLGWYAGSPSNKEIIKNYTKKKNLGVYNILDKDIIWYFDSRGFNNYVKEFYLSNYKNCKIQESKHIISTNDTISRIVFFIPSQ